MSTPLSSQSKATPLEHGADIGFRESHLPSAEQARALAMQAALSSHLETQQPREYSPLEKIVLLGKGVVTMRHVESTDNPAVQFDEQQLAREMEGVLSRD